MYENYFSFQRAPFSIAPDPSFLYPGPQHKKGLAQLNYGLNKEGGFIVLTGEVGTGKTTLSRLFLSQLDSNTQLASVYNAKLNSSDLLSNIASELGLSLEGNASEFEKTQAISQVLLDNHQQHRKTLLMIEEAQNLSPDSLETLRLLTNIETDTAKLLHIVLIGQPELVTTLNRPDLRQLNQRVIARYHLRPLTEDETENYIIHRLSVAGGQQTVFKRSAIQALFQHSGGIPRLINLLADRSLQLAYEQERKQVNGKDIETANELIHGSLPPTAPTFRPPIKHGLMPSLLVLAATAIAVLVLLLMRQSPAPSVNTEPATAQSEAAELSQPKDTTTIQREPAEAAAVIQRLREEDQLLHLWGIAPQKAGDLCTHAEANELECFQSQRLSLNELVTLNRPALITVFNSQGIAKPLLLSNVTEDVAVLYSQEQNLELKLTELAQRWRGDALLLWKPAPGWIDSVREGDRSVQVIHWLQQALNDLGEVEGKIITGGYYTEVLSAKVASIQQQAGLVDDGILGRKTVMAINSRLGHVPRLSNSTQTDDTF